MTAFEKTIAMLEKALEEAKGQKYFYMNLGEGETGETPFLFANKNYAEIQIKVSEGLTISQKLFHTDEKE